MEPGRGHDIHLSEEAMGVIRDRMSVHGFTDAAEYLESLIAADFTREERRQLEKELIASIESGPSIPMDDAYWERLRRFARERGADTGRSAA
jgi:hypothetical protein